MKRAYKDEVRKIFFVCLALCTSAAAGLAQGIGPSTFNAAGGGGTIGGFEFDWSVGEMTMVSTFTSPGIVVTQGILQPFGGPSQVVSTKLLSDLSVFPNPATSTVNVQYIATGQGVLSYRLLDMTGRLIKTSAVDIRQGTNTEQVNVASLAAATYMLEVSITTADNATERMAYKIQKLQ